MDDSKKSKMPDGLTNSISSFLKRTDNVSEELKSIRRERGASLNRDFSDLTYGNSSSFGRDLRSTSVARASSVGRQFETSPIGNEIII